MLRPHSDLLFTQMQILQPSKKPYHISQIQGIHRYWNIQLEFVLCSCMFSVPSLSSVRLVNLMDEIFRYLGPQVLQPEITTSCPCLSLCCVSALTYSQLCQGWLSRGIRGKYTPALLAASKLAGWERWFSNHDRKVQTEFQSLLWRHVNLNCWWKCNCANLPDCELQRLSTTTQPLLPPLKQGRELLH